MEKLLLSVTLLFTISYGAAAQTSGEPGVSANNPNKTIRICAPSKGQLLRSPMFVIYSRGKIIFQSDTLPHKDFQPLNALNPQSIKKINVLKDTSQTKKYGDMAKYGVVEVYLDDEKYPKARKAFRDSIAAKSKQAATK